MAKKVDWYYRRNGCNTCKKMDAFLEEHDIEAKEIESANKIRYDEDQAVELASEMSKIIAARGKSVTEIKVKGAERDLLVKHLIGPSGKLRSPAIRKGKTLYIGFSDDFADTMA